jgi:hypothetical protein
VSSLIFIILSGSFNLEKSFMVKSSLVVSTNCDLFWFMVNLEDYSLSNMLLRIYYNSVLSF